MNLPKIRLSTRRLMLLVALITLPLAFDARYLKPYRDHRRWFSRVDACLEKLNAKQPQNLSIELWTNLTNWNNNLHGNCGFSPFYLTDKQLAEAFADELELRVEGPVDLKTIDWIWDEYMRFTRLKSYNRFRPTTPANMEPYVKNNASQNEVPLPKSGSTKEAQSSHRFNSQN